MVNDTRLYLMISFLAAVAANAAFFATGGRNLFLFVLSLLGAAWFLINLRLYLKKRLPPILQKIVKSKYMQKSFAFLKQLFERALSLLAKSKLAAKLTSAFSGKTKINRLSFFSDEKFILLPTKKNLADPFKKMKWKNLKTNRERIRYIYIAFMKKKIKQGFSMDPTYTPNEVYYRLRENDASLKDELFSLYNVARYKDDENSVTKNDVESVLEYASKRLPL